MPHGAVTVAAPCAIVRLNASSVPPGRVARLRAIHDELIVNSKRTGHRQGSHARDCLVRVRIDHSEQQDPAVHDNDVNGVAAGRLGAREPARSERQQAPLEE